MPIGEILTRIFSNFKSDIPTADAKRSSKTARLRGLIASFGTKHASRLSSGQSLTDVKPDVTASAIPSPTGYKAVFEAKKQERAQIFQALKKTSHEASLLIPQKTDRLRGIQIKDSLEKKATHLLLRQASRNKAELSRQDAQKAAQRLVSSLGGKESEFNPMIAKGLSTETQKILFHEFKKQQTFIDKPQKTDYPKLTSTLRDLKELLQTPIDTKDPSQIGELNKKALKLIRKALSTESYQLLCHDGRNPAVKYLHQMVFSLYTDPTP